MMKHLPKLFGIVFVLLCLALAFLWGFATLKSKSLQQKARQGLDQVVANELPTLDGFDTIEVASFDSSDTVYGDTCYYATDYLIMGMSFPESKALEQYVEGLLPLGWTREGRQYPTTKTLIHGRNARIVVDYGDPGVNIRDAIDFNQLRNIYQSIIFVRVDYMLPMREGC